MTDFLWIDGATQVQSSLGLNFASIDNSAGGTALDPTRSALLSILQTDAVSLSMVTLQSSTLTVSPAMILDTVQSVSLSNGLYQNLKVANSDLIISRKVTTFMTSVNTFANVINQTPDGKLSPIIYF